MQNLFEGRNHHCKFVAPTSQASSHQQAHAVGTLISVSMFYVVMSMPNVSILTTTHLIEAVFTLRIAIHCIQYTVYSV